MTFLSNCLLYTLKRGQGQVSNVKGGVTFNANRNYVTKKYSELKNKKTNKVCYLVYGVVEWQKRVVWPEKSIIKHTQIRKTKLLHQHPKQVLQYQMLRTRNTNVRCGTMRIQILLFT
jgi:hypothetical protein